VSSAGTGAVGDDLLVAHGLTKRFGGVQALAGVDVTQRRGESLGMIGPNGSGKTSFVNAITGHLSLDAGTIRFGGADITGTKPHRVVAAGVVRTFQAVRLFSKLSVRQNLEASLLLTAAPPGALGNAGVREMLEWLQIDGRMDAPAGGLTLFEQRRLELAMRLLLHPRLIMLDEPAGGLAPGEVRATIKLLNELKARCSIFVIEHTMRVIRELSDRVVVLITGKKVADGPPEEILKDARIIKHYLGGTRA
jgi:ABC-type branched-subunit amino acid transport system ATPase component